MSEELEVYGNESIAVTRPPEMVLAEAQKAAKALTTVLKGKKKPVIMNGEQYLEFEDWQTVGKFYGITVKVLNTNFIQYGDVRGFEARAVVLTRDGQEISAAEAMCLNDEDKWSVRTKYEWRDNKRVKVGEEPVPLFQLRSMAQTRACAKALRNVLAWVVVLAGYKATPAEEMTGHEFSEKEKKTSTVQPSPSQADGNGEGKPPDELANPNQFKAINTILTKMEINGDLERHETVAVIVGLKEVPASLSTLTKSQASKAIEGLQAQYERWKEKK